MVADLVLQLLILAGALVPPALALAGLWRRACPAMPASECVLASALTLPVLINLQVLALGLMPWNRPLDALGWVHAGVCVVSLALVWAYRGQARAVVREAAAGFVQNVRACLWLGAGILVLAPVSFGVALVWGVYNVPCAFDELAYQLPQALQLLQDGRWAPVKGISVWADSYPRGATTVFYWTIALAGGDAGIHPASASGGLVMSLAAYVAGRRLGLDRRWATLAAAMTLTAPTVFYLSTVGYIDLMVAGAVSGVLAFIVPERTGEGQAGPWGWGSLIACLLATVFALWMKVTVIVPIGVLAGLRGVWEIGVRVKRVPAPAGATRPNLGAMIGVALLAGGAGIWPYVRTHLLYGTPTWPIQMKLGPVVIFDGPVTTQNFVTDSKLALLQRLSLYWTGWFDELTADSRGGLGPLFLIAMVAAGAVLATAVITRPRRWGPWVFPLGLMLITPLAPMHHIPRYGVYIVGAGALACGWLGQRLWDRADEREIARGWVVALTALVAFNVYVCYVELRNLVTWQASLGFDMWGPERNRPVLIRYFHRQPGYPMPQTMLKLQEAARPGELVATSTAGMMTWFHSAKYDYRVEHRPAAPWPVMWAGFHNLNHGMERQTAWLAKQNADGTAVVMTYKGSVEDRALEAQGSGFGLFHEEPATPMTDMPTPTIRIWRRK